MKVSRVSISRVAGPLHSGHEWPVWKPSTLASGLPFLRTSGFVSISGSSRGRFGSLTVPQLSQNRTGIGQPQYRYLLTNQSFSLYSVFALNFTLQFYSMKCWVTISATSSSTNWTLFALANALSRFEWFGYPTLIPWAVSAIACVAMYTGSSLPSSRGCFTVMPVS